MSGLQVLGVVWSVSDPSSLLRVLTLSPEWSAAFHFAVFFLIFFGILVRPLKERFGRAGSVVSAGFALLLSASLALSGRFHLLDLEPLATVGFFVVFGGVIAAGFRRLYSASWITTIAVGIITGYGAMRLSSPRLFSVAADMLAIQDLVYVVAFAWLAIRLFSMMFGNAPLRISRPGQSSTRNLAAQEMVGVAKAETEDHHVIVAELEEVSRALQVYTKEPGVKERIRQHIKRLLTVQRKVAEEMDRYVALIDRFEWLDAHEYAAAKQELERLPSPDRKRVQEKLSVLHAGLLQDATLRRLADATVANNSAARAALLRAKNALESNDTKACLRELRDARATEQAAERLAGQIRRQTEKLTADAARVVAEGVVHASLNNPG